MLSLLQADTFRRKVALAVIIPLLLAIVGTILLTLVSFIPNGLIYDHAFASADQLCYEDDLRSEDAFYSPAGFFSYSPDNFTDSLIMQASYTLTSPSSALKNPVADMSFGHPSAKFMKMVCGEEVGMQSYSRYWMGFRIFTRPLLAVTAYRGIRIVEAALYYSLFVFAALTIAQRNSLATAMAFAVSCLLTEHYAVSASLQFSCCFLLMFAYVIALNFTTFRLSDGKTFALFCLFGAATQFFDFYTYPLITCLFPLIILVDRSSEAKILRSVFSLIIAWLASYFAMWLIKLSFVTVFTSENGFYDAMQSVFFRFGVGNYKVDYISYSSADALASVWARITKTIPGIAYILLIALFVCSAVFAALRHRTHTVLKLSVFAIIFVLPIIWFSVAAQPTIIHTWFQYRLICASCFSLLVGISNAFSLNRIKCIQTPVV